MLSQHLMQRRYVNLRISGAEWSGDAVLQFFRLWVVSSEPLLKTTNKLNGRSETVLCRAVRVSVCLRDLWIEWQQLLWTSCILEKAEWMSFRACSLFLFCSCKVIDQCEILDFWVTTSVHRSRSQQQKLVCCHKASRGVCFAEQQQNCSSVCSQWVKHVVLHSSREETMEQIIMIQNIVTCLDHSHSTAICPLSMDSRVFVHLCMSVCVSQR